MQHVVRSFVCVVLLGTLAVACTMQRTNALPEDDGQGEGTPTKPAPTNPAPSATTPAEADASTTPDAAVTVTPPAVDAAPAAPTGPTVTGFTLINADDDQPIANYDPITEGATITLAALPSQNLNIRANTVTANGLVIGSVAFDLDGVANFRVEGAAPYALAGDTAGDFPPLTPALATGAHTLSAKPYSEAAAAGTAGQGKSLNFTLQ